MLAVPRQMSARALRKPSFPAGREEVCALGPGAYNPGAMKSSLRWFTLAACFAVLAVGCQKKETVENEVARDAETKLPAEEQVEPVVEPAPGTTAETLPGATAPTAAADQANYEVWFKKHHLDLSDPKMLDEDPDGDGFSNRDEFLADSNPHDKNARPGVHKTIRLKEFNEVALPLVLESIEGDKARIKRTDQPDAKAVTVKAGDSVRGLPLKVRKVETKEDFDKTGERVNLSQVAFEDSSTKETIVLMKDLPARTSATYAVLMSPDGKTTLKVHKDEVFSWPAEPDASYKVIDLSQDQVVLQQIETKKTWTIPRQ